MSFNRRTFMQAGAAIGGGTLASCATGAGAPEAADPLFNQPFIDLDEWRDAPVRHRYVHGGFHGTDARFVFYFPPVELYQGRFFQYISPVPVPEDAVFQQFGNTGPLGFAVASGAYLVASNQGGTGASGPPGTVDPSIAGYRVSAAAANHSRVVAAEMYGAHRTYGYCYGGSGGAFRTIGCVENSTAWDGSVPFVMGSPMAIPNVYTVRCQALRLLEGKFPQIVDALEPGGGGDMYAGLNAEQRAALAEATSMGFPPRSWAFYDLMGIGAFAILFDIVQMADPTYFTDFWTVPGYLGADPPQSLLDARVRHRAGVVRVVMSNEAATAGLRAPWMGGPPASDADSAWRNLERQAGGAPFPAALQLRQAPPARGDLKRASVHVRTGVLAERTLSSSGVQGDHVLLATSPTGAPPSEAVQIQPGDEVEVDNSNFLAVQTYHRHQTPGPDYPVWDQFRNADGSPRYPQRPRLLGPSFQQNAAGTLPTARFNGKMIVVETLMDYDAFPWQADWYRRKVEEIVGARLNDRYRLWYIDHAVHGGPHTARTVSYDTVLQQALRDLSAWVERGVEPPPTTNYRITDGQVIVPASAAERAGVQPVVTLDANGGAHARVRAGETVQFSAVAEAPPNTGAIVTAEWDFEGTGGFSGAEPVTPAAQVTLTARHAYARPGTYFAAVRVASQREGDVETPYAKLYNLARARVVVS